MSNFSHSLEPVLFALLDAKGHGLTASQLMEATGLSRLRVGRALVLLEAEAAARHDRFSGVTQYYALDGAERAAVIARRVGQTRTDALAADMRRAGYASAQSDGPWCVVLDLDDARRLFAAATATARAL
jgi:hypothetical protein